MSDRVTRLLLIRHGETAWNIDSRIQGHTDIPLNDVGRWQAERVALALADEGVDAVFSSDLQRARDTAEAIARTVSRPLQLDEQLRERHFGRLEGLTHGEIHAQWPDDARRWRDRDPHYGPDGGETLSAFYERCVGALRRVAEAHPGQTVVVVAHRLSTVRDADLIAYLEDGRIAAQGRFDELQERSTGFRRLVELGSLDATGAGRDQA